jgi:hypothetical protein
MKSNQEAPLRESSFITRLHETDSLIDELVKHCPAEGTIQISKNAGKVEVKIEDKAKPQIKISGGLYDLFW